MITFCTILPNGMKTSKIPAAKIKKDTIFKIVSERDRKTKIARKAGGMDKLVCP